MKILVKLLLCLLVLALLCACQREEPPVVEEPSKDWVSGQENEEEVSPSADIFYPCGIKLDEDFWAGTDVFWNEDNTLTFQMEYKLVTLNGDNEIIKETELSQLPGFEEKPTLIRGGKYIFAYVNHSEEYGGVIYRTYNGKIRFANMALYSEDGEFIKDYPRGKNGWKTVNGVRTSTLPIAKGDVVMSTRGFHQEAFSWIDDTTAYIRFYSAVGIYDFEKDKGKIIWDGKALREELGAADVSPADIYFVGNTAYFTAYETYDGYDKTYLWKIEGETPKKIGLGNIIYGDGENLVYYSGDDVFLIREGQNPLRFCSYSDIEPSSFSYFDGRINYSAPFGEEKRFYSYNIESKTTDLFSPHFESYSYLKGAKNVDGKYEYYFTGYRGETYCLWKSEGESENGREYYILLEVLQDANNAGFILSPNMEYYAALDYFDNYHRHVKVGKISSGRGVTTEEYSPDSEDIFYKKFKEDYTQEELDFYKLRYRHEPTEDFFEDFPAQSEFDREYKLVQNWLSYSADELNSSADVDKYNLNIVSSANCPEEGTIAFALLDEESYLSPYYYIWCDFETNETKLIHVSHGGPDNHFIKDNLLVVYERNNLFAFDMSTGEGVEVPLEFSFGYQSEAQGNEFVIMAAGYDKKAEHYVVAYYENFLADDMEPKARIYLGVYDKEGKFVKKIDTEQEVFYSYKFFYLFANSIEFPKSGEVKISFFDNETDEIIITSKYLKAAEEKERKGIAALWTEWGGGWEKEELNLFVRFFRKGEDFMFSTNYRPEGDVTAKVTYCGQLGTSLYRITLDQNGEEFTLFVNTGKSGDYKMTVYFDGEEPVEYTFMK